MNVFRQHTDCHLPGSACALGMFDGVHLGHRMVLENAIRQARILGLPSVVFSFADHPQRLLAKTPTQLLTSLEERLAIFESLGFDAALVLDFTPELQQMSPERFVEDILLAALGVRHVTVGYDHRFGKDRAGNGEWLSQAGRERGFAVDIIQPVKVGAGASAGQITSSTLIRKLLSFGEIQPANQLLGRPYHLSGTVTEGFQRGRQLGFPTANLTLDPRRVIPAVGIYGGFATLAGETYPAVCNLGHAPTFDGGTPRPRMEVHLLDYTGPAFYGETLTFDFTDRLRDEMAFDTVEALMAQIEADCALFRERLAAR